jgi:uncharacterized protein YkwD
MGQVVRIGAASACAALAASLPAQAGAHGGCPDSNASSRSAPLSTMRAAVVCLVNRQRTERGLPRLSISRKLNVAAQRWTDAMVSFDQFSHARFVPRIDAVHYHWQVAAENIATGYPTPRAAVRAWMASPDHCRNILNPAVRNVGTGERAAPVRGWASGPATWTQDFGLSMTQPAPSRNYGPAHRCPYR